MTAPDADTFIRVVRHGFGRAAGEISPFRTEPPDATDSLANALRAFRRRADHIEAEPDVEPVSLSSRRGASEASAEELVWRAIGAVREIHAVRRHEDLDQPAARLARRGLAALMYEIVRPYKDQEHQHFWIGWVRLEQAAARVTAACSLFTPPRPGSRSWRSVGWVVGLLWTGLAVSLTIGHDVGLIILASLGPSLVGVVLAVLGPSRRPWSWWEASWRWFELGWGIVAAAALLFTPLPLATTVTIAGFMFFTAFAVPAFAPRRDREMQPFRADWTWELVECGVLTLLTGGIAAILVSQDRSIWGALVGMLTVFFLLANLVRIAALAQGLHVRRLLASRTGGFVALSAVLIAASLWQPVVPQAGFPLLALSGLPPLATGAVDIYRTARLARTRRDRDDRDVPCVELVLDHLQRSEPGEPITFAGVPRTRIG